MNPINQRSCITCRFLYLTICFILIRLQYFMFKRGIFNFFIQSSSFILHSTYTSNELHSMAFSFELQLYCRKVPDYKREKNIERKNIRIVKKHRHHPAPPSFESVVFDCTLKGTDIVFQSILFNIIIFVRTKAKGNFIFFCS